MIKIIDIKEFNDFNLNKRNNINSKDVSKTVSEIIENVKKFGDKALIDYEKKFDNIDLKELSVTPKEIEEALELSGKNFISVLERAAENIRAFHSHQLRNGFSFSNSKGVILGQKIIPLERVGLYVPGGTASYPSSVLMNVIPAKIAGCKEIYIASPSRKPEIIAAAHIAGADKIFKIGGAQAVAAFAFGTESIPKVDKIAGPGNIYVAEAKRQVFGNVSIDMIAGPSEILIIADENNNPAFLASDMLAQSEHDKLASAILITNSKNLALNVQSQIEIQIKNLIRHDIARDSVDNNGCIILLNEDNYNSFINSAVSIANEIAPEHLELCLDNPFELLSSGNIRNAGSVFLGRNTPEALGDYFAGPNHTLPTMGTARFSSPLSVDDFVKKTQYIYYSNDALRSSAEDVAIFANSEGLTGHARSILIRTEN